MLLIERRVRELGTLHLGVSALFLEEQAQFRLELVHN